jgi:fructokinase
MSIAVLGEALIDFIQDEQGGYHPHLGGSPYNVAVGLARQGIEVAYLSPLASDAFGDRFAESFEAEGVSTPITRRSSWPTSLALVSIDPHGMPAYKLYREGIADKDSTFEEVRCNLPAGLSLFHTGSLAITPSQLPKIRDIFEYLRASDVLISVDINIRLGASIDTQAYIEGVISLVESCDIIKVSDEDLAALSLHTDPRIAAQTLHEMCGDALMVLTEGRGGVQLFSPTGRVRLPAYPIAQVADTIGAGDTFHAAFLASLHQSGLLKGALTEVSASQLERSLDYACAAAAINVSRVGCAPPTHAEVIQFIESTNRNSAR